MPSYNFYYPVQVRYSDLDPQWHVNNARYLSYLEQARLAYIMNLGHFDGEHFFDLGLIVADVHIAYVAPIHLTEKIRVGMKVTRLGNKSLNVENLIDNETTGEVKARAEVILVTYDYNQSKSIPIPQQLRQAITAFEGITTEAQTL